MSPTHPAQSSSLSPPTRRRLQSDLGFEVSPMSPRVVEANEQLRHGSLRLPLVRVVERLQQQQQHGDANAKAGWPSPCSCFRTTVPNPHPGLLFGGYGKDSLLLHDIFTPLLNDINGLGVWCCYHLGS